MNAPITSKELDQCYGIEKTHTTRKLIIDTMTRTVRRVNWRALSLPFAKTSMDGSVRVAAYPLEDVVSDYGVEPQCMPTLMAMIEQSDCPYVAAWRAAIALRFAEANADDVDGVTQ